MSAPELLHGDAEVRSVSGPPAANSRIAVHYGPSGLHLLSLSVGEARRLAYLLLAEAQELAP